MLRLHIKYIKTKISVCNVWSMTGISRHDLLHCFKAKLLSFVSCTTALQLLSVQPIILAQKRIN